MANHSIAISIIVAALLIGGAIIFGNRYSLQAGANGSFVWRIDRLTGKVSVCEHGDFNPFCGRAQEPIEKPPETHVKLK